MKFLDDNGQPTSQAQAMDIARDTLAEHKGGRYSEVFKMLYGTIPEKPPHFQQNLNNIVLKVSQIPKNLTRFISKNLKL